MYDQFILPLPSLTKPTYFTQTELTPWKLRRGEHATDKAAAYRKLQPLWRPSTYSHDMNTNIVNTEEPCRIKV